MNIHEQVEISEFTALEFTALTFQENEQEFTNSRPGSALFPLPKKRHMNKLLN